jgi:hypothetical protein
VQWIEDLRSSTFQLLMNRPQYCHEIFALQGEIQDLVDRVEKDLY